MEQTQLEDYPGIDSLTYAWAFALSVLAGCGFLVAGAVVIYDNVSRFSCGRRCAASVTPSADGLTRFRARHRYSNDVSESENESSSVRGDNLNNNGKIEEESRVTYL